MDDEPKGPGTGASEEEERPQEEVVFVGGVLVRHILRVLPVNGGVADPNLGAVVERKQHRSSHAHQRPRHLRLAGCSPQPEFLLSSRQDFDHRKQKAGLRQ